ncbi:MAG: glutamine amidotransferase [Marmoricola sp.]
MKPFLLLSIRSEDIAAHDEREAIARAAGLDEDQLAWHRLDREPLPPVDLDDWSGFILGGGAYNFSDRDKAVDQVRAEADLYRLLDQVVAADFPFFGACYGVGVVGSHQGGLVDRKYGEPVGRTEVRLTEAGQADPIFVELPAVFDAFLGHKEAINVLPANAVLLASSSTCPTQAFRIGENIYVTQFHPELDSDGLCLRVEVYPGL